MEEAITLFEHLVKENPNDAGVLAHYAKAMRDSNQYDKAITLFDRAVNIKTDDAKTLISYSILLIQQGAYEKAFSLYDILLELGRTITQFDTTTSDTTPSIAGTVPIRMSANAEPKKTQLDKTVPIDTLSGAVP